MTTPTDPSTAPTTRMTRQPMSAAATREVIRLAAGRQLLARALTWRVTGQPKLDFRAGMTAR
jgi:hypothetical protein